MQQYRASYFDTNEGRGENGLGVLEEVKHGLIVSCQALEDEPLHGPLLMAGMAYAATQGGAQAIRANGGPDISLIKRITNLPVFGIKKVDAEEGICITPDFAAAAEVALAGADAIAVDGRQQVRRRLVALEELIPQIQTELGRIVMVDIKTVEDAVQAARAGADAIATTWAFRMTSLGAAPDFRLLKDVIDAVDIPVIAEGGYWTPAAACHALDLGAWAVVVGTAITRPQDITKRFVQALQRRSSS